MVQLAVTRCVATLILLCAALTIGVDAKAQVTRPDTILASRLHAALAAQVEGWGGCRELGEVNPIESPFFPDVKLYRAHCTAEHGDTLYALAAQDAAGTSYLLDSPSGFRFLSRVHPPRRSAIEADPVGFAHASLRMMGLLSPGSVVSEDPSELPAAAAAELDLAALPHPLTGILSRGPRRILLAITAATRREVRTFQVTITDGAHVTASPRLAWNRSETH